ncbi:MAG TPA: prepilin-type N-terminal cleavage/methylation domain-containing protein [Candidatus Eremiobacteraceae bacterium]|nr:prepilin-type N-terminal cleavage/methylation domain-containing protein [Candidatus Eremiobacteraceae bacterium]
MRSRGLSLIEAMVGMVVLLIGILMLVGAIPAAYGFTAQDSVRVQAVSAGQEYLDDIRQYIQSSGVDTNLPPAPTVSVVPPSFSSDGTAPVPVALTLTPSCTSRSLFSFDCSVNVQWSADNGPTQKVKVESYITSQAGF